MASICSVTTIDPSSLAIDDAFRPETMMPVSTAPSSRIIDRLTNRPVTAVAPNAASVAADCTASTPPVKNPASRTMVIDPTPTMSDWMSEIGPVNGRPKEVQEQPARRTGNNPAP